MTATPAAKTYLESLNLPADPVIVQKFGGTSVGTVERIHSVAERIAANHQRGFRRIAVVVSAMAGETNRLLALVAQVNPQTPGRISDFAVAAGEQVAVALLAAALEGKGVRAVPFLGFQLGVITDEFHQRARIQGINTQKIHDAWQSGSVPIIAGFQGVTNALEITTLGRGGGDTSAVAVAVALRADLCEIYTDVDGVFTANPREVPEARLCERMDFNVALEMASLGSKVLHNRCVELAAKYNVPLVVRNSFKDEKTKGTLIMAYSEKEAIESPVVSGVSLQREVAKVTLSGLQGDDSRGIAELFKNVADVGVNVDIIVHNQSADHKATHLGFTVKEEDLERTIKVITNLQQKSGFAGLAYDCQKGLAKVSVVGLGMISHPGVASRTFVALTGKGIGIHMISTSEIKISCVVDAAHGETSAQHLHNEFIK